MYKVIYTPPALGSVFPGVKLSQCAKQCEIKKKQTYRTFIDIHTHKHTTTQTYTFSLSLSNTISHPGRQELERLCLVQCWSGPEHV